MPLCAPLTSAKMRVDAHVPRRPAQTLALPVRNVLLRLWVAILLGHAEIHDVNHVGGLCARSADQEVVGLDVAIDEVLLVDSLDSGELATSARRKGLIGVTPEARLTICFAVMQHVLMLNFLWHMSKRSSRDGPSRSMTRMLCSPSWPK